MRIFHGKRVGIVAVLGIALAGCGGARAPQRVTVLAAASLARVFPTIVSEFEKTHPDSKVSVSFGPSDALAQQINAAAPADVFASASPRWMDAVGPHVRRRSVFARNSLAVLVPAANPARIGGIADLARPGIKLVLAAEAVPVGEYARAALAKAGIAAAAERNVVSNEDSVRGVVQKVALGEADAGIAYVTDASAQTRAIAIPVELNMIASYPIAVLRGTREGAAAQFVDFVLGAGQAILRGAGFLPA